jgi:hypothetical protein
MDGKNSKPHAVMRLCSPIRGVPSRLDGRIDLSAIAYVARTVAVAAALSFPGAPLLAQDHEFQQWTLLVAQGRINENFVLQAEVQPRLTDDASRLGQIQISSERVATTSITSPT